MNSQVPSAPSSSLCPEKNAQKKASEAESEWLRWPYSTTRKPWYQQQSISMSSYPVHRSLPPTRRSSSDESLVPGEVQDKPPNLHTNLSLLRATRIASNGFAASAKNWGLPTSRYNI
jgi:hypothetical protein